MEEDDDLDFLYQIKYKNCGFYMDDAPLENVMVDNYYVIGNIHDNPELLKE